MEAGKWAGWELHSAELSNGALHIRCWMRRGTRGLGGVGCRGRVGLFGGKGGARWHTRTCLRGLPPLPHAWRGACTHRFTLTITTVHPQFVVASLPPPSLPACLPARLYLCRCSSSLPTSKGLEAWSCPELAAANQAAAPRPCHLPWVGGCALPAQPHMRHATPMPPALLAGSRTKASTRTRLPQGNPSPAM